MYRSGTLQDPDTRSENACNNNYKYRYSLGYIVGDVVRLKGAVVQQLAEGGGIGQSQANHLQQEGGTLG